jgi:hypothetical protein
VRRTLERFARCLSTLSPAARTLLRDRAGLDGSPPATLRRLAADRRTSSAVVRSQLRRAVRRLRAAAHRGACSTPGSGAPVPAGAAASGSSPHDGAGSAGGSVHATAADRAASGRYPPTAVASATIPPRASDDHRRPFFDLTGSPLGLVFWGAVLMGIVSLLVTAVASRSSWAHRRLRNR